MLTVKDFSPSNWPATIWQITASVYVRGYILPESRPSLEFMSWASGILGLNSGNAFNLEEARDSNPHILWKLTIEGFDEAC